jgi:MFS superfamily sulfate permease-like transporter
MTVIVVLLFFTPLLYYLPQSVLAAVIMMAVLGLVNVSGFIHAWKAKWYDWAISIICFICTLAFAPDLDKGILVGVVLSLSVFLYKSMRPRVAILSKYPDGSYHDADTYDLKMCEHIAMVRFDGPLFFANATYLEDQVARLRLSMPRLKHILIVASGIDDMDATGEETFSLIVDRLRSAGYQISLSGVKKNILDVMKRTYLYEKIGREHFFPTQAVAVESIHKEAHEDTDEGECPLSTFCPIC